MQKDSALRRFFMRDQSCPDCNRLWREYSFATNADIKLNGQVKMAALQHEPESSKQLTLASDAATQERESLRRQIKEHEASHIGSPGSIETGKT
jgi:hypothetical protein